MYKYKDKNQILVACNNKTSKFKMFYIALLNISLLSERDSVSLKDIHSFSLKRLIRSQSGPQVIHDKE